MEILFLIIAVILTLIGLIGSVVPALPGASLNFLAILILYFIESGFVSNWILAIFGILTLFTMAFDYIFPILGAKKFGVSKYGIWGLILGMVFGFITFSIIGLIIGAIIGAIFGELVGGKSSGKALNSGFAAFWGVILSMTAKFLVSLAMAIYFFIKFFDYILN